MFLALVVSVVGCGSPEKYQKQGAELDTALVDVGVGLDMGKEHGPWARSYVNALSTARQLHAAGETANAIIAIDTIIASAERTFDTLPFRDQRAKFLTLLLTDAYTQAVSWQVMRGDTLDAQARISRFEALGARVHRMRDSVEKLQ